MNRIGIQKIVNVKVERPVILFVSFKGSLYGNHFVMVYKYVKYNGVLWFKAYDNQSGNKIEDGLIEIGFKMEFI